MNAICQRCLSTVAGNSPKCSNCGGPVSKIGEEGLEAVLVESDTSFDSLPGLFDDPAVTADEFAPAEELVLVGAGVGAARTSGSPLSAAEQSMADLARDIAAIGPKETPRVIVAPPAEDIIISARRRRIFSRVCAARGSDGRSVPRRRRLGVRGRRVRTH